MAQEPANPEKFAASIARARENLRLREQMRAAAEGAGAMQEGLGALYAVFAAMEGQESEEEKKEPQKPAEGFWEGIRDGGTDGGGGGDAGERILSEAAIIRMLAGEDGYTVPVATTETSQSSYEVTAEGVWHSYVKGKVFERELIAFRPFVPMRRLKDDRGETQYTIAWLTTSGEVAEFTRTANDLNSRTALNKAFPDVVVTSNHAAACVEYLAQCLRFNQEWLEERSTVSATGLGWPEGMGVGEMDTEAFTSGPGRPRPVLDVKNTGAWLAGHEGSGRLKDWTAAMAEAGDRPLIQAMVTASLSAPLLRVLGAANFVVDLSGLTSGGKTIALSAAASVWGDPRKVLATWQDTRVALEHKMSVLRGMPFFVDETQLADEKALGEVVYSITGGQSRGRSRQDGSGLLDAQAYETVLLTTGEQPLTSMTARGGISPRIVALTGTPCRDVHQANTLSKAVKAAYGLAGDVFLAELGRIGAETVQERWEAVKAMLEGRAANQVGRRRAASVAVLAVANEVAASAGLLPLAGEELWEWLVDGGDSEITGDEDDRPRGALRAALGWAVANAHRFWGYESGAFPPAAGWVGRWEGHRISFRKEVLYRALEESGYTDAPALMKAWKSNGWLQTQEKGTTFPVEVEGRLTRHTVVVFLDDMRSDGGVTASGEMRGSGIPLGWVRGLSGPGSVE